MQQEEVWPQFSVSKSLRWARTINEESIGGASLGVPEIVPRNWLIERHFLARFLRCFELVLGRCHASSLAKDLFTQIPHNGGGNRAMDGAAAKWRLTLQKTSAALVPQRVVVRLPPQRTQIAKLSTTYTFLEKLSLFGSPIGT